ncbi:uncharacterized protein METZ01_LOCUS288234, partial [marine metagenome]
MEHIMMDTTLLDGRPLPSTGPSESGAPVR